MVTGIGVEAGDCAAAFRRTTIDLKGTKVVRLEYPVAQHQAVFVALAATAVSA
jgi:hypothetical protein